MDSSTVHGLIALNNRFYREQAASFASTRHGAWLGWHRCMDVLRDYGFPGKRATELSVFDCACGNLRFEEFLADRFSEITLKVAAVDNCPELLPEIVPSSVSVHDIDVLNELTRDEWALQTAFLQAGIEPADLAVAFGFFHHVPSADLRVRLLRNLIASTLCGGYVVVSFWRFAEDEELAQRARETTLQASADYPELVAALEAGDHLVGWQGKPGAYRYCHSFTLTEVGELAEACNDIADIRAGFASDGRTGQLNIYAIFRVR